MIEKVISGGQIGADFAGLVAAQFMGIKTGGWAPKGFMTAKGPMPALATYGLKEHESEKYPPRTFLNVRESDGTIRFAVNFESRGELCTLKALTKYKKPFFDVAIRFDEWYPSRWVAYPGPRTAAQWIKTNNIQILNVAGNASKEYGFQDLVELYLKTMFTEERRK